MCGSVNVPSCPRKKSEPAELKGWKEISDFLGQPVTVAQRWARQSKMPVSRRGKFIVASPKELSEWLGRESGGEPVHVATGEGDLSAELKRGLAFVRSEKHPTAIRTSKKRL